jgi:hypothetical protein
MLFELGLTDELAQPTGPEGDLLGGFQGVRRGRDGAIQTFLLVQVRPGPQSAHGIT